MTRAIEILTSRWCISFIGTALLAGLAWFFAPLLPGFEDWPPRVALIVALLLVWGGGNALLDLRRLRRDAALARASPQLLGADRRGAGTADAADHGTGPVEEIAAQSRLSLRTAVVRDHRPSRRRQNDGAAERRLALSAGGADGPGRGRRRRRHAAVRLVVHRGRRADRHRRSLYHAGLKCRDRPRRLGCVPRPAEADPAASAAERSARRVPAERSGAAQRQPNARHMRRRSAPGSTNCRHGLAFGCPSTCCSPRPT